MPPSASQEAWSEIVPPTACASSDNPINPRIKILAMIGRLPSCPNYYMNVILKRSESTSLFFHIE